MAGLGSPFGLRVTSTSVWMHRKYAQDQRCEAAIFRHRLGEKNQVALSLNEGPVTQQWSADQ